MFRTVLPALALVATLTLARPARADCMTYVQDQWGPHYCVTSLSVTYDDDCYVWAIISYPSSLESTCGAWIMIDCYNTTPANYNYDVGTVKSSYQLPHLPGILATNVTCTCNHIGDYGDVRVWFTDKPYYGPCSACGNQNPLNDYDRLEEFVCD